VITELVASLTEDNTEAVFDFSQYLHNQGSVELALFMLDDYTEDNHQHLDILIDAIKAKDLDRANNAIIDLQLNAKILAASDLAKLCTQWIKLLSGDDIPNSLKEVNILLKETRSALTAIDGYAESI
jgi:HPt (histidine-containing phosphotransfer) domain-containing protein